MIFEKTAVIVLVWQKAWQCFHGALPICFCGWSTLSLLPVVHSCTLLPVSWHPETQRVFGAVPFSVRVVLSERLPRRVAHQVHQQLTKDQIQIAGPCGRVTSKALFSFLLLILLLREAANSKTFAAYFDVSEWATRSLQLNSIHGKITSRALGEERC